MNVLLDTQAFFWSVHPSFEVPAHVRTLLGAETRVWVSDVSAFEVATKVRLGKFDDASFLVDTWDTALRGLGASPLGLTTSHAVTGGSMAWDHRDPFDRLIVAQARVEGLTLVTADRAVLRAPEVQLFAW